MSRMLFVPLVISIATACSDNSAPAPTGTGEVRLFHGVADLGPVTIEADTDVLLQSVAYGKLTGPVDVAAGSHVFRIRNSGTVVASQTISINDGAGLTLVLSRQAATIQLAASADTGLRQPDRANLRLISAPEVPGQPGDSSAPAQAGVLDVYITAPGVGLAGESPRLTMDTGTPSYSTFLYYAPGPWAVRFTRRGTKTVVAESGSVTFAAGDAKAVVIRRVANGSWTTAVEPVD